MLAAAVQLNSKADKAQNIEAAVSTIRAAAAAGAELVVLPEYTDYLGPAAGASRVAEPIPGSTSEVFGALAAELGIVIVAGSHWERSTQDSQALHNTVVVFDRLGELVAAYRKLHVFDAEMDGLDQAQESRMITAGDRVVNVQVDDVRLGLATCYDLRFPEIFRLQALKTVVVCSRFLRHFAPERVVTIGKFSSGRGRSRTSAT